jgi:acyl transferase domain-containing protein
VIEGAMIFPGVAYLEMARMAGELARPKTKVTKLINTIWAKPVIVQRPVPVYISLYPDGDMIEFEVFTPGEPRAQEEQRVIHSRGKLISGYSEDSVARGQSPESVDLAVLKQSLNQVKSGRECYQLFQEIGFNYGTGFQAIRELYEGETQSMAALELPGVLSGGFGDFVLHPSLMDGALQAIVGILQNRETRAGTIHLPYAVGEIEILKPLTRICYACASLVSGGSSSTSGIKKFDIRICDQAGNVLIKIKDFSTRAFVYDAARKTPEAQIPEKQPPLAGKAWETQLSELLKKVEAGTLNAETADEMMEAINE